MVEVPAARINLEFVLGNKVVVGTVNGNREYFEAAIRDLAIAEAEGHLKKGLLILSQEIGLAATSNVVSSILARLHGDIPDGRLH